MTEETKIEIKKDKKTVATIIVDEDIEVVVKKKTNAQEDVNAPKRQYLTETTPTDSTHENG